MCACLGACQINICYLSDTVFSQCGVVNVSALLVGNILRFRENKFEPTRLCFVIIIGVFRTLANDYLHELGSCETRREDSPSFSH